MINQNTEDLTQLKQSGDTTDSNLEKILGAEYTDAVPQKLDFDVYKANASLQLFSMMDPVQHTNAVKTSNEILARVEVFAAMVRDKWPDAFKK